MATAADHYESLLAEHYTWMLGGGIEEAAAGQADLFRELGLTAPVLEGAAAWTSAAARARRLPPWRLSVSLP